MHVLIIVENLPVPADYRVWLIAETLRDAGYQVSIICPASGQYAAGEFELDGIAVLRHPMPRENRALYQYLWEYSVALWHEFRLSWKVFRRQRFQIIHACNPPDVIWIVGLFWRMFGVRFVYDHHDLAPELLLAKVHCHKVRELSFTHRLVYWALRLNERISHRLARVVLATNETFHRIAVERNKCAEDRVFTVRTGPRAAELPEASARLAPASSSLKVAYVGVMATQDGVDGLLRAAHYAQTFLHREFQLVLMGNGPQYRSLYDLCRELDMEESVTFLGFVPRERVYEELMTCVMGVTPDPPGPMNDASTMLKVLEYMCCGLPQVMYDLAENRASARNAALYATPGDEVDFAEKMVRLIDDVELRKELGRAGCERVKELTWERCGAPGLLAAYDSLLSRSGGFLGH